ncbi:MULTISPECIES: hypothetical protein [unclassified Mycobacterium]|uniref:hypothetical protein n=1 Tax=unclassified Mycobacterium TaxID=2642494 RepID=UPI000895FD16|nr:MULTISPECIES: hypothetical protein [unclassified Mycobacterium]SEB05561.1 hypothetical protein SAMN04488580_106284 [Mycobacterium sp. 283mftsu]
MSTNPEVPTPDGEPEPGAPSEIGHVESITYEGPGSPGGPAVWGEVIRGVIGAVAGIAIGIWGCIMIKDGITGDVAFALHYGENNSLEINTGWVGLFVLGIGAAIIYFTAIKIDWKSSAGRPAPSGDTKAEGA